MKTTRTFIIVLTFACVSLLVNAQFSTNELPFSFRVENQHLFIQKNAQINSYKALLPKTVEELNTEKIKKTKETMKMYHLVLAILYLSIGI